MTLELRLARGTELVLKHEQFFDEKRPTGTSKAGPAPATGSNECFPESTVPTKLPLDPYNNIGA